MESKILITYEENLVQVRQKRQELEEKLAGLRRDNIKFKSQINERESLIEINKGHVEALNLAEIEAKRDTLKESIGAKVEEKETIDIFLLNKSISSHGKLHNLVKVVKMIQKEDTEQQIADDDQQMDDENDQNKA